MATHPSLAGQPSPPLAGHPSPPSPVRSSNFFIVFTAMVYLSYIRVRRPVASAGNGDRATTLQATGSVSGRARSGPP
jgi:hypothetical protein